MTTPDPFPTFCVTMDCGLRATRYVTCEGEGKHPYCDECADVLVRGGESDLGPVEQPSPDPTPTPREEWRVMDGDDQVCRHAGHTAEWAEDQCRRLVERFPEESFRIERRAAGGEWEAYCPASTPMGSCSPRCGDPRCEEATRVR